MAILKLATRFLLEPDPRLILKFMYNFGWKGMLAVRSCQQRLKRGEVFPAFLFLSITNNCNLRCKGCWVRPTSPPAELSLETMDTIIQQCKTKGSYFYGILGGEPLLHPQIFELIAKHPDAYFQIFTNGTRLTQDVARTMRKLGNVTPLLSVEGMESVSDERRGGSDVYQQSMQALAYCRESRLITGVATSVCRSNIDDLVSEAFVRNLVDRGVMYLWYYVYRPVGPEPCPELALTAEQILRLRKFMVEARTKESIALVDAYWDHEGKALCPAATGISHHINPSGDIEPCPPIQFARDSVGTGENLDATLIQSTFLQEFRTLAAKYTRGCVIMDHPNKLSAFMREQQARDTSGRDTGFDELAAIQSCPSHDQPGSEIPEKQLFYRFAKKNWFFGFGAYG